MKSPNLFIITFILFLTDLNDSVSATKLVRKTITHQPAPSSNVSSAPSASFASAPNAPAPSASILSTPNVSTPRTPSAAFAGRSNSLSLAPSNLQNTPNLPDSGLKVVSVTKALANNTTITSDEHLTNESSVSKELSKNLRNQELKNQEMKNQELKKKQQSKVNGPKKIQLQTNSTSHSKGHKPHATGNSTKKVVDECSKTQFDYLVLSLTWPVNLCSQRACVVSPQRWFIHNLSPLFHLQDNNQISQCCKKRPFNASELGPITGELKVSFGSFFFWFGRI